MCAGGGGALLDYALTLALRPACVSPPLPTSPSPLPYLSSPPTHSTCTLTARPCNLSRLDSALGSTASRWRTHSPRGRHCCHSRCRCVTSSRRRPSPHWQGCPGSRCGTRVWKRCGRGDAVDAVVHTGRAVLAPGAEGRGVERRGCARRCGREMQEVCWHEGREGGVCARNTLLQCPPAHSQPMHAFPQDYTHRL